jgi:hypothetical protein
MAGIGKKENLKHLSSDEARKNGSKGGRASVQSRRNKKTMREALEMLMFDVEVDEAAKDKLRGAGINEKDFNNQMLITLGLMKKAREGDVQAYNAICAMIGEKPADKLDLGGNMRSELNIVHISKNPDDDVFPSSESEVEV